MTAARARLRGLVLVALVALGALLLGSGAACRRASEEPIATLVEAAGVVEKTSGGDWIGVAPGVGFDIDDGVRTGARATASLRFAGGGVVRMSENSRLRFRSATTAGRRTLEIAVDLGEAEIEGAPVDLSVLTGAGTLRMDRGGRARVSVAGQDARLEVVVGRAVLVGTGGEAIVEAGQGITFRIGGAIVERFQIAVGKAIVEAVTPATPPPSSERAPGGPTDVTAPRADTGRADVTFSAGESPVLHDGRLPLNVRLRFDGLCPGEGAVELGAAGRSAVRSMGQGAVVLRLRAGTHAYRVWCAADPAGGPPRASGVLTLRRDTGDAPLARRAPTNEIDADGKRYTVFFQTRLPALTLVWSPPDPAGELELHLESPGSTRTLRASTPRVRLPSGALAEGTHTWWYATRKGHESPRTTVTIRFDNAAPIAQFFRATPAQSPAGAVPIDGVALEGAKVSAAGQMLEVDPHGRFRGAVSPLEGDDAIAVRLEHPHSGVHYYVRRRWGMR